MLKNETEKHLLVSRALIETKIKLNIFIGCAAQTLVYASHKKEKNPGCERSQRETIYMYIHKFTAIEVRRWCVRKCRIAEFTVSL